MLAGLRHVWLLAGNAGFERTVRNPDFNVGNHHGG